MTDQRGVRIPYVAMGAAVLWLTAVGLMGWDTFGPEQGMLGRWALLTSAAAAAWTIIAAQCLGRRKLAETVVRKMLLHDEQSKLSRL